MVNNVNNEDEDLGTMKNDLDEMEVEIHTRAGTHGFSTGQSYGGIPLWQCD